MIFLCLIRRRLWNVCVGLWLPEKLGQKPLHRRWAHVQGVAARARSLAPVLDALKQQQGYRSTLFVIRAFSRILRLILKYAPSTLLQEGVDVVLADQNEPAAASVAEHLRLPFASICTSLPLNREAEIPPSFTMVFRLM